jgi:hypothetical protein
MTGAFIKMRLMQFSRILNGIGLFRALFLAGVFCFSVFLLFQLTSKSHGSFYTVLIILLLVLFIHVNRRDKLFLRTNFDHYKGIFFTEYLALSIPVSAFLVFHQQWLPLLMLFPAIFLIIHMDFRPAQPRTKILAHRLIPAESFEWKGGTRRTLFLLAPIWIIGMCGAFYIGCVPIVLLILGIIPFSFYERGEPYQMIIAFETGPVSFLLKKIKMVTVLFTAISLPLIAAFIIFHYELWYIPLIEYFIFITIHVFLVLTKYAFYEPNEKSPAAQTFAALGALSGIIPLFLPVVWLLSIRFFFRSRENLNFYLNDYH